MSDVCNEHPRPSVAFHPGMRGGWPTLAGHRLYESQQERRSA